MNTLFTKMNSYHIFTNIIPGGVILFALKELEYKLFSNMNTNLFMELCIMYFLGLICSRISSILTSIFKKINIIKYHKYNDYLYAVSKDNTIYNLLDTAYLYRSFVSVFIFLIIVVSLKQNTYRCIESYVILVLCCCLFIYSYIKQNNYVYDRISYIKEQC